jgi:hypothetical protein
MTLPDWEPTFRIWIDGVEPATAVLGDGSTCRLVTELPGGARAVALAPKEVPMVLAAILDLGPRPAPEALTVRLAPGAMAILIGRRQAHGHGLPDAHAIALQRRLDTGVRHWSVRLAAADGRRRNLEVVEGADAGIWRVKPVDELVELVPTTTTAVLRELVALVAAA